MKPDTSLSVYSFVLKQIVGRLHMESNFICTKTSIVSRLKRPPDEVN